MAATNQNFIVEEIKRKLYSSNVLCHSVQNVLSSPLLPKIIKIRMYKTSFVCDSVLGSKLGV
jgi:hypothetical protein